MTSPTWLIAEREFRTYVATLSFWAALAIGPLAAGGGLFLAQNANPHAQPVTIAISGQNANLASGVKAALNEAAALDGRRLKFTDTGARLTLTAIRPESLRLDFERGFPLSAAGRVLVARTLERDAARMASNSAALTVRQAWSREDSRRRGPVQMARFLLMAMLWLTLTGSLGMLLQAVARERATRSLESLLAAATPWQVMVGKLAGVGGVSLLVLAAWICCSEALVLLVPKAGLAPSIIAEVTRPTLLARAAVIYALAYAFYGSITVALGALARDTASAQNLARPMFILLMVVFFIALALALESASASPSWLLYVPPLTPFLLLVYPASIFSWSTQLGLFAFMAALSFLLARIAVNLVSLREARAGLFGADAASR